MCLLGSINLYILFTSFSDRMWLGQSERSTSPISQVLIISSFFTSSLYSLILLLVPSSSELIRLKYFINLSCVIPQELPSYAESVPAVFVTPFPKYCLCVIYRILCDSESPRRGPRFMTRNSFLPTHMKRSCGLKHVSNAALPLLVHFPCRSLWVSVWRWLSFRTTSG